MYAKKIYSFSYFLQIPHLVKIVEDDSLYFKVVSPVDVCNKVAPGMTSTFTVLFTPHENKVNSLFVLSFSCDRVTT